MTSQRWDSDRIGDVIGRQRDRAQAREQELSAGDAEMARFSPTALRELARGSDEGLRRRAELQLERLRRSGALPPATQPAPAAGRQVTPSSRPSRRERRESDYYAYVTRGQLRLLSGLMARGDLQAVDLLVFLDLLTRKRKGSTVVEASMNQVARSIGRSRATVQRARKRLETALVLTYACTTRTKGRWDLGPGLELSDRVAQGLPLFPPDDPEELTDEDAGPHPGLPF